MAGEREIEIERSLLASAGGFGAAAVGTSGVSVPTIDLALGNEAVGKAMMEAATTVGFFQVKNHGISQESIDEAFATAKEFFARPQAEKERECPFAAHLNSGYEHEKQVRPSTGTADLKESFQMTAREGAMDGRWPQQPSNFQGVAKSFLQRVSDLGKRIMSILEPQACPSLEPGTLARAHNLWGEDCQTTLRMLHYWGMSQETLQRLVDEAAPKTRWRAGPHTDWTCVTLLFQQPGGAGLECAPNPKATGAQAASWLEVPPQEGCIAINIGDMLSLWSGGRVLSNLHRVRLPNMEECAVAKCRYSIAVFMQADKKALIQPEGREAITAGDYILSRITSNFSKNGCQTGKKAEDEPPAKKAKVDETAAS
eukprot:CAMPEP_0178433834 /NCGR_PEP_ID=MMETSP0689_2-20121128/33112_1 /TAXON_ID=160604 /ORGANISM="Amphidinium massartii, Strain CS-259" /LENGTH=368 /DNA_ID=CAMNT_0020055879 /DNA_START=68 /DNA_END=1174 /DNA_ORIENTATION=+